MVVPVAFTDEEINRGLSDRAFIGDKEGMLFILQERAFFTVQDMKTPIDIIWMDSNHIVTYILDAAQPGQFNSFMPDVDFSFVLEMRDGFAWDNNIDIGTQIPFKIVGDQ
jgi:uncharacterized membrane protein (UPF0127 family)